MLKKSEVELVQADWAKVVTIADAAATIFYDRLFELDPKLKALFKSDLGQQKEKLMSTLSIAVRGLTDFPALVPALQQLGRRHVGYGVRPADYDTVGAALLWTLKAGLGADFTSDNESAWAAVYGVLAGTMTSAPEPAAAAPE